MSSFVKFDFRVWRNRVKRSLIGRNKNIWQTLKLEITEFIWEIVNLLTWVEYRLHERVKGKNIEVDI